jgi:alkylhydroperoxidase family enzyme
MKKQRSGLPALLDTVLNQAGHAAASLRQAVFQRAQAPRSSGTELPEPLQSFTDKVSLHSYRVTDEDYEALRKAGHSEDQLFELTICASLGAAKVRLDRGLRAIAAAQEEERP